MRSSDFFSSRWGLILAGVGMAVGTGNLWRFPRVAAENGGGTFLIPWLIFLVTWSIPLLIAEFAIGRKARRGPIGAFVRLRGERCAWMGGFVVVTTAMIMFYYSVVTGWTLKYVIASVTGTFTHVDPYDFWSDYSVSVWQPVGFHFISIVIAGAIVSRGVVNGIERANRVLVPTLFIFLLVAVARALTLPGASQGLMFLFVPNLSDLMNYRIWLEALTQSAWSTGAGWGLMLSYAVYVHNSDDVVSNSVAIGIGNNIASILAALAIIPAAFAILPVDEALGAMAAGNIGLTFVWLPQLFQRMPGGDIFLPLFFTALFCAALSSLIAMVELATRALIDTGLPRQAATKLVVVVAMLLGLPSAVSMSVFENQDWVWGLALMISGICIAYAAIGYGVEPFRKELVNTHNRGRGAGRGYALTLKYLVPIEFVAMFSWWIYQAVTVYDAEEWWNPIRVYSIGSCLFQWGLAFLLLFTFNKKLALKTAT